MQELFSILELEHGILRMLWLTRESEVTPVSQENSSILRKKLYVKKLLRKMQLFPHYSSTHFI